MFRILGYLILISLISSGYYLFIFEYFNLSEKKFLESEIIKNEIVEDKNSFINSIFKKKYTSALMSDHVQRKKNNQKLLWTLYVLENWYNNQKNASPLF